MRRFLWIFLFAIVGYLVYSYFIKKNYFVLEKINFSGVDEVDTIEAFPNKGVYILQLIRNGALGHFSTELAILKHDIKKPQDFVLYEFDNNGRSFRITKDHISFAKTYGITNYGWFYFKDGKAVEPLPSIAKLSDSIEAKRNVHVSYRNGYMNLYSNGGFIQTYNYGNLILKDSSRDFNLLKPGLYKLSADNLSKISNDPDAVFKQKEGIYFVPPPGYGIIKQVKKETVLNYIDSIFALRKLPNKITFKKN